MSGPAATAALRLSPLPHLWIIDVDGTILAHNGHLAGDDDLLPGVRELWDAIPPGDTILLLSARAEAHKAATLRRLEALGLRYDRALFDLPVGERILINDAKPSGLATALAVNVTRDGGLGGIALTIDPEL